MAVLYKISEVSKITGIPIDTIRYYVKEGLIAPVRRNSFHYYSTWDIHYLMDYKKYRFLEMSPNDIRGVFFNDTLEEYTERLHTMRDYYHSRSVYYHLLEKRNCIIEDLLHKIPAVIGHFRMTEYPEAYFLRYTRKTDFAVNETAVLARVVPFCHCEGRRPEAISPLPVIARSAVGATKQSLVHYCNMRTRDCFVIRSAHFLAMTG